jgi:NTE family protein
LQQFLRNCERILAVSTTAPAAPQGQAADIVLALGGGNALGAYHLGLCEEFYGQGLEAQWIVGASIGAVTGAILLGNPPEQRLARLRQFWEEAAQPSSIGNAAGGGKTREIYNAVHSTWALLRGRPTVFRPRFPGLLSALPWMPNDVSLYDHGRLRPTLERLVDFDLLNRSKTRLSILAIDVETAEEVWFDNHQGRIGPEHVLASAAISPLFPPVEIEGRLLCDPGYVNNLPLDHIFVEPPPRDVLCFAAELFSLRHHRPTSLDAVIARAQDISFASHARRSVDALRREYGLRRQLDPNSPSVTVVHLAYHTPDHELGVKSFDYSPASIHDRAAAGRRDLTLALDELSRRPAGGEPFAYRPIDPWKKAAEAEARLTAAAADPRQELPLAAAA